MLTTGCQLRLDVEVDVNRNGGGNVAVAVGADAELSAQAAEAGADPLGHLAETAADLRRHGWTVTDRTDGEGARTVTLRRPFRDAEEFNLLAEQLAEALAADEVVLLERLRLTTTKDEVAIEGAAGAVPTRAVRDYGVSRSRAVRLLTREEAVAYTVTVTLPGETTETTAPDAVGAVSTWHIGPGESVAIAARGTRPGPPLLRAALGALGGGLLAGGALWLWSRRRTARPEGQESAAARSARMRSFSART